MNTSKKIVTRFAPSPTGYLHIGGARTALYNYLFAKKHQGTFILRIEDTDLERSTQESIQAIIDGMNWLGLDADEGPYYQTKRFDLYHEAVDKLVAKGSAYPCFCTADDINKKREIAQSDGQGFRYDRTCYHLSSEERQKKIAAGEPHCVRFYSEDEETIVIQDKIKGEVRVEGKELDDLVIQRTDGAPTYNLTVVVDDASMGVTHVIRGDDHLRNTFRQVQMYKALEYDLPIFAHLPLILGQDKKRLSKRHGAMSVMAYKDMGYLPEAVVNYLVRLGWAHGDQEVFTKQEMIEAFNLDNCSTAAACFDFDKLGWLNGHYIKEAQPERIASLVREFYAVEGLDAVNDQGLVKAVSLSLEKARTIKDLAAYLKIYFVSLEPDLAVVEKNINDQTRPMIQRVYEELEKAENLNHDVIHAVFEKVMAEFDVKLGKVANPVRVALSGQKVSPGAYDLIEVWGKEMTLKRLDSCLRKNDN
ncbi:glutamate--tRNA ligase [bacterium]|nr:glutamate--tRNA ligase [bacterium]